MVTWITYFWLHVRCVYETSWPILGLNSPLIPRWLPILFYDSNQGYMSYGENKRNQTGATKLFHVHAGKHIQTGCTGDDVCTHVQIYTKKTSITSTDTWAHKQDPGASGFQSGLWFQSSHTHTQSLRGPWANTSQNPTSPTQSMWMQLLGI